ncbi:MAG: hypothetical protein ACPGJS_13710 [Flammeovirgaceae bacterium]
MSTNYPYQAFYCEENIWHLANVFPNSLVLFILNYEKTTKLYYQKAAAHPLLPIHWDYHVILLREEEELIYDFDTHLGFPVEVPSYFNMTFNIGIEHIDPNCMLRFIHAQDYLKYFSSDRSHMKDEIGNWIHPPPAWELIQGEDENKKLGLDEILNLDNYAIGKLISLNDWILEKRFQKEVK